MLPNETTIKNAIAAAERTLEYTREGFRDYEDKESVIRERIHALNYVLRTGKPYTDIIKKYHTQEAFRERYYD